MPAEKKGSRFMEVALFATAGVAAAALAYAAVTSYGEEDKRDEARATGNRAEGSRTSSSSDRCVEVVAPRRETSTTGRSLAISDTLSTDVPPAATLSSDVPPAATLSSDVPPAATLSSDVPPAATLSSDVPPAATLSSDVPPAATLSSDVPPATTLSRDVPPAATLSSDVPPAATLSSDASHTDTLSSDAPSIEVSSTVTCRNEQSESQREKELLKRMLKALAAYDKEATDHLRCQRRHILDETDYDLESAYERCMASRPEDPHQRCGVSSRHIDNLLAKYSNDSDIRELLSELTIVPQSRISNDKKGRVSSATVISIYEFMLKELTRYADEFCSAPHRHTYDTGGVLVAVQALVESRVEEVYDVSVEELEAWLEIHNDDLTLRDELSRLKRAVLAVIDRFYGS